jgi:hypothetical protein
MLCLGATNLTWERGDIMSNVNVGLSVVYVFILCLFGALSSSDHVVESWGDRVMNLKGSCHGLI